MSGRDPIASPTLAQLYIAQGHLRKARAVVDEVLERDPFDGHALHLASRLRAVGEATLSASVDATEIALRWQRVPFAPATHVVLVCFVGGVMNVRSVPCSSSGEGQRDPVAGMVGGEWTVPRPRAPGSAAACIGRVVAGRGFVALTVARPVSWER
jgi:hypothetical protein